MRFEERYRSAKFDVVVDTIGGASGGICSVARLLFMEGVQVKECIMPETQSRNRPPTTASQANPPTLAHHATGDYNGRSLSVLKPNGYIAHILAQGWAKKHGDYLGNVYEMGAIAKGCALPATGCRDVLRHSVSYHDPPSSWTASCCMAPDTHNTCRPARRFSSRHLLCPLLSLVAKAQVVNADAPTSLHLIHLELMLRRSYAICCRRADPPFTRSVIKSTLRWGPRYQPVLVQPSGLDLEVISKLVEEGKMRAVVDRTFKLEDVRCAAPVQCLM